MSRRPFYCRREESHGTSVAKPGANPLFLARVAAAEGRSHAEAGRMPALLHLFDEREQVRQAEPKESCVNI